MNKILPSLIIFLILIAQNGSAQSTYENDSLFSESNILKHLKSLSSDAFEGRRTGTDGAIKAKKYIINQFHTFNVDPLIKDYEQPFRFINRRKYYKGVNVLGTIKGSKLPEKYIVISAHYDHEGIKYGNIYNGADDNASGISALFAFAEYFKNNPPNYSVILAAFDAEELQIKGSKYFMDNSIVNLNDIVVNLNMDMISRSAKNELFVVGTKKNMRLKHIINEVENTYSIILKTGHDGYDGLDNWTYSSDHINFYKKDIPFLYFGVEDHKDYHEPTDDYENIQPEFYIDAVKTIIKVFEKIDNSKF